MLPWDAMIYSPKAKPNECKKPGTTFATGEDIDSLY
jgi:hypothetical protein